MNTHDHHKMKSKLNSNYYDGTINFKKKTHKKEKRNSKEEDPKEEEQMVYTLYRTLLIRSKNFTN